MRRFKFNLESVLIVRQKTLDDARRELGKVLNILNKQNEALNRMFEKSNTIRRESENLLAQSEFNPSLIANYNAYLNKISHDIKSQKQTIEKTKLELIKCQSIVKNAYIEVKTLEKLKEKRKIEYEKEILQEEIKLIDDIVSSKRTIA